MKQSKKITFDRAIRYHNRPITRKKRTITIKKMSFVYVLLMMAKSKAIVKIGISTNLASRVSTILEHEQAEVMDVYIKYATFSECYKIETAVKKDFLGARVPSAFHPTEIFEGGYLSPIINMVQANHIGCHIRDFSCPISNRYTYKEKGERKIRNLPYK